MRPFLRWLECLIFVLGIPAVLYVYGNQRVMVIALWGTALLCLWWLWRQRVDWRVLWHGQTPSPSFIKNLFWRVGVCAVLLMGLLLAAVPEKLFGFISERPWLWLAVMCLYPILSVIPQELIYRSFFFRRYGALTTPLLTATLSGIAFGLSHLMFNNWIAPILSLIGGLLIGYSYTRHQSLKWAVIEHTLYGWILFTLGLGWFFYLGAWRPVG